MSQAPITLRRLIDLEAAGYDSAALVAGITAIFRATAAKWPDDPAAAQAFQTLWLDQYLNHERELVYLAVEEGAGAKALHVAGYLVGCRINPALSQRFVSLAYFQSFAAHCATHPAHLHINLDAGYRNQGIGAQLVEALCAQLKREGIAGVHVVTARDQRNAGFYTRLGFRELASAPRGSTEALFLARSL